MTLRRRAVLALTVATLLTAALNVALAPNERPVMFELAPNADALQGVERIQAQTHADFLFIGAYTGLWGILGASVHPALTTIAIAAGLADVAENVGILRAIARGAARTDDDARSIRSPSYVKWSLLAALWSTLAFVPASLVATFAGRLSIGLPYAVAAVVCIVGLILSSPWLVG